MTLSQPGGFIMASYGMVKNVKGSFDQVVAKTRECLKSEGFGVITEIDVQKTVKEKLGERIRPYLILGACNPPLAHQAITTEPEIGLLMPCNVCVWENQDGAITVAAVDVKALFQLVQNPSLVDVAESVNGKLRRVLESVV
jgi:uncharacterized protein (DUF302 family)